MDLDTFIATHRPAWDRLRALIKRGVRGRSAEELDELVRLYRRVSGHLSTANTLYRDPGLTAELTELVGRANGAVYGGGEPALPAIARFWRTTFPAACWNARRAIVLSAVALLLPAFLMGLWLNTSAAALAEAGTSEEVQLFLDGDFVDYYSDGSAAVFGTSVFANNALVGIQTFAFGLLILPAVYVLVFNGLNVGYIAGLAHAHDRVGHFWGLILPHGLLELTAIFFAGGAAFALAWRAISPGDRRRREALAEEGLRTVTIVLGLVPIFAIAALLEAFVTPQPWPTFVRVGFGAIVWIAFLTYVVVLGRDAASRGLTGRFGEERQLLGLST